MFLFVFFYSTWDLRAPSADRRETLARYRKVLVFDKLGAKIWGPSAKKVGAKNVQNLDRFRNSDHLKVPSWIPPEWIEISKIGKTWWRAIPSTFCEKSLVNFDPLTTPYYKHSVTHPNRLFLEDHISDPRGRCWIFTRAREWPRLASAHPTGDGVPQQFLTMNIIGKGRSVSTPGVSRQQRHD